MSSKLSHKLRRLIFSPDSNLELWVRSRYHQFAKSKVNFLIQDWLARQSFIRFMKQQRTEILPEAASFKHQPKVTFILECQNHQNEELLSTLNSIRDLTGSLWQVLLHTHPDCNPATLPNLVLSESRIQIVEPHQDDLLDEIEGDYIIFCAAGDIFEKSLLQRLYLQLDTALWPEVLYYDCVINEDGHSLRPFFKPGTTSPAMCLSHNMLSRSFIRTEAVKKVLKSIKPSQDLFAQEYDLCLRLLEERANFYHLPSMLVSQKALVESNNSPIKQIIIDHLERSGYQDPSLSETHRGTRVIFSTRDAKLSIIIPTKNNQKLLRPLLQSIKAHKGTQSLEINLVDNGSDDQGTLAYYREIESEPHLRLIPYKKPFNYSEAINLGVSEASYDLILLLNDDMELINSESLSEMIQWALQKEIGVVGAKLLRKNRTIQHTGIIMGLVGFVGHIYLNTPEDYFGLWGSADWYRDILAVTGACQMVRREVFEEVGGYDDGFKLAFGDIDFCIRVHQKGYRNLYSPFASLYHYEGHTRGYVTPVSDILRGYDKFEAFLIKDDPCYSPNLTYSRIPKCAFGKKSAEEKKEQIAVRKAFYLKSD